MVVGTPSYMAPEQARGKKIDTRSDLYATAVVLYELLTGRRPFRSDVPFELIRLHVEAPPPSLAEGLPSGGFSPALEQVMRRALAKSPDDRYQTPDEMTLALSEVPEAARPAARRRSLGSSIPSLKRAPWRWGWLLRLAVFVVLAGGGFAIGLAAMKHVREPAGSAPDLVRLGHQAMSRDRPSQAMALYAVAVKADPAARSNTALIKNAISALGPESSRPAARALLKRIGPPALAQLRTASRSDPRLQVRKESSRLLSEADR
jgi:hypothetical protein